MKYKVQHDYTSNIGTYDKGSTVEIDDELAEHLNRDSPGLLKPTKKSGEKSKDNPPKVNDGSVEDILGRVGDDVDAAAEVLEAEKAEKKPRTTLIEGLEAVLAGDDDIDDGD